MNRLCIIPCGAKKIWDTAAAPSGPCPAKRAYISPFHRKCQAYADRFFDHWAILSAKHGFLLPDDRLDENYNVAFGSGHPAIISLHELKRQVSEKRLDRFEEVVVLGGKKFTGIVPEVFPGETRIYFPLVGSRGIGDMLQKLNRALERNEPFDGVVGTKQGGLE